MVIASTAKPVNGKLPRTLGFFSGTLLCTGMMIGSGVFSTQATILGEVGSVGAVIAVYIIGGLISFAGTWAYVELGCMRPVSGGEKEYLDYCFANCKAFFAFTFSQSMTLLVRPGQVAADAVAFGSYFLYSVYGSKADLTASGSYPFVLDHYDWIARFLAVIGLFAITFFHGYVPKLGIQIQNILTIIKTILLFMVVIVGIIAAAGGTSAPKTTNYEKLWEGTKSDGNAIATALFSVFFSYDGWNNLNYCLDELIDPVKTLPKAAFFGLSIVTFLYISATASFFVVVPVDIIDPNAAVISAQFFERTVGTIFGARILPMFIAFSALGASMTMTFGSSRVLFESAKDGYLPYGHIFGTMSKSESPLAALWLHLVVSLIYLLAPPPGETYRFLIDVSSYPQWVFYGISVVGLLYMRFKEPHTYRPVISDWTTNILFILASIFLTIFPFVPPVNAGHREIPYWLYPTVAWIWIIITVIWWYYQIIICKGLETSMNAGLRKVELQVATMEMGDNEKGLDEKTFDHEIQVAQDPLLKSE